MRLILRADSSARRSRAPQVRVGAPQGPRAASTAILLSPSGGDFFSALHRVRSDEVWHHYDGDPVDLYTLGEDGAHVVTRLGRDLVRGEQPQHVVMAGVWQGAACCGDRFALCGCTVAPGFDFADFEMPSRADLLSRFPLRRDLVERLTRG